jgi:hypothetical protein
LPGFLPERTRRDLGAGFSYPSEDGGFDELREFIPRRARNSTISRPSFSITLACSVTKDRKETTTWASSS